MIANLTAYLCAALIEQSQTILAGHLSELGNSQPVTIYRARPQAPVPAPPHLWFEAQGPRPGDETEVLGNTVGFDGQGNQQYGAIWFGPLVDFGLRCRQPFERDALFDALYQAYEGFGVNPATGNRWVLDVYRNVGVLVAEVVNPRLTTIETTTFGPLYEATGSLVVSTVSSASFDEQIIQTIDINPVTITLAFPAG